MLTLPPLLHSTDPTRGLLFIGDPHVWSKRPGRRRDDSFLDTVLRKLQAAATIANEQHLWPVILGDLFHDDDDDGPEMLAKLVRVLQSFHRKPVTIVGNHEKNERVLTDRNALALLRLTGQIDTIEHNAFWARIPLTHSDGRVHTVAIGGTPFGRQIPHDLRSVLGLIEAETSSDEPITTAGFDLGAVVDAPASLDVPDEQYEVYRALESDSVVWLTHEDLAFEGAYPGSHPLHPVIGADMVVNGHVHGTKRPVRTGATTYYNPGNIVRLSVDMVDHIPSVWSWEPFDNEGMPSAQGVRVPLLAQHVLEHASAASIFNFEGRHGKASLLEASVSLPTQSSQFVEMMKQDSTLARTDDGIFVQESMAQTFESKKPPEPVQWILNDLWQRALKTER